MKGQSLSPTLVALPLVAVIAVAMQACTRPEQPPTEAATSSTLGSLPTPRLHHVGLNVVDPAKSQQFYKTIWPTGEITTFADIPAYKAEMYLLFTKVDKPAPGKWDLKERRAIPQSAFWHIGVETSADTPTLRARLKAANATIVPLFRNMQDTGTIWRAGEAGFGRNPIVTEKQLAERTPGPPQPGGYAYFLGPDQELVEAGGGPGQEDMFNHAHLLHEKPWCAANWYIEHLGFRRQQSRNPATNELVEVPVPEPCDVAVGPPSWPSLQPQGTLRDPRVTVSYEGGILSWYARPCQQGRCPEGDTPLVPSRRQVLDHIGLTYPDLDTHVTRLRREGVKIVEEIRAFGPTRAAMIEDPDGLAIMLVERYEP